MNKLIYGNHHQIVTFNNLKLNYWSIPKCASTTIKYALHKADCDKKIFEQQEKQFTTNDDIHSWVHAINICEKIEPKNALNNGYINFMIIRNPIERFLSLYKDFFIKRKNNNVGGSSEFKDAVCTLRQEPSVKGLLNLLNRFSDNKACDVHFRSQTWFYLDSTIKLIRLENMKTAIQAFNSTIVLDNLHLHKTSKNISLSENEINQLNLIFKQDYQLYEQAN